MDKARILVVEDEGIVAADIHDRLVSMGYSVVAVADSGEEALARAAETRPDMVIMDIMLKGAMDGTEAAEKLRSQFKLPVIYLSAYSGGWMLERAKVTEPFGYILKPFEERDLKISIELALHNHRMARERERLEQEREQLIHELREALNKVKTLSGLLPICCYCKKIRDDAGYWNQVEDYISSHTDAAFTHGYCPECYGKVREEAGLPPPPSSSSAT